MNEKTYLSPTTRDANGLIVGRWKTSIFGCCDEFVPNGLTSFICPGISLALITERLGIMSYYIVLSLFMLFYFLLFSMIWTRSALLYFVLMLFIGVLFTSVVLLRTQIRFLFSIPGEQFKDFLYVLCCGSCAIAQMASHVEAFEPGGCNLLPRDTLPGYTEDTH